MDDVAYGFCFGAFFSAIITALVVLCMTASYADRYYQHDAAANGVGEFYKSTDGEVKFRWVKPEGK
jgi:uncharacterized protein involved in high-affinity Fe2+ transport